METPEDKGTLVEGADLEDALNNASKELGIERTNMEYRVVDSGAGGLLGLFQKKKVVIRAWESEAQSAIRTAQDFLTEIIGKMGISAKVSAKNTSDGILLNIKGDSEGLVIGRKGQTLDALQYITNRYIHRHFDKTIRVILDSEGYRRRREAHIKKIALDLGKRAKKLGKPVAAQPMGSVERRLFHLALKPDRELRTESRGEGEKRKVIVYPVKGQKSP
jgi:spoIIIJ-associated protein